MLPSGTSQHLLFKTTRIMSAPVSLLKKKRIGKSRAHLDEPCCADTYANGVPTHVRFAAARESVRRNWVLVKELWEKSGERTDGRFRNEGNRLAHRIYAQALRNNTPKYTPTLEKVGHWSGKGGGGAIVSGKVRSFLVGRGSPFLRTAWRG